MQIGSQSARSSSYCTTPPRTIVCGGFSLLELVIVVTIVTVMAVAVTPVFRGSIANARQDQSVRDLVAFLKFAQERAIADCVEYRVYLDSEKGDFWLMRHTDGQGDKKVFAPAGEPYAGMRHLPDGVDMSKPKAKRDHELDAFYVAFYPSGACDYASIRLASGRSNHVVIDTKGYLGRLKVASE